MSLFLTDTSLVHVKTAGALRRFDIWLPFFLALFFLFFPQSVLAEPLMIELPEVIEARAGILLLGEYAKIEGEGKILSRVSMMSIEPIGSKMSRRDLVSALSRNGFGGVELLLRMPEVIRIVPESDLVKRLRQSTGWEWRIDVRGVKKEELGRFTLPARVIPGTRNVVLHLLNDEGGARKRQVKLTWYQPMLFAVRDLARGEPVKAEDFELRVAVAGYREVAVSSLDGVVGALLRRRVSAGEQLEKGALSVDGGIVSGQPVTLVGKVRGLIIETQGIALERGAVGAMIRVRNVASRKIVYGRVLDASRVEIRQEEGAP